MTRGTVTLQAPPVRFSAPGVLFAILGGAALLAPFMTLAANRIVAGDAVPIWSVVPPGQTALGLGAVLLGLALGVPAGRAGLRMVGLLIGLAGLLWLVIQGAP
ncbi:MAG: ABC transporter permease, partial [Sulfitobacter litoralis]|nr:ABC transporter permease [Sulfitobacter litoralis]